MTAAAVRRAGVDRVVPVAAGVLARGGRLLVCQRRPGGHHPLKWEFPGGKAEPGERAVECLRRELREELGIDPIVGRLLWRAVHRYPGRVPFALSFFAVRGYRGVLTNRAFAALRWVPLGGLTGIDFLEGDRALVAEILRGGVHLDDAAPLP